LSAPAGWTRRQTARLRAQQGPELMLDSLMKALRAAVVVVGHAFIAAVLVGCASAVDHLILYLNDGHEMMVYNRLPLSYLFQTVDVALIGVFGIFGVLEAIEIMRE
jgi:Na+-driven multidrug efflux pump